MSDRMSFVSTSGNGLKAMGSKSNNDPKAWQKRSWSSIPWTHKPTIVSVQ